MSDASGPTETRPTKVPPTKVTPPGLDYAAPSPPSAALARRLLIWRLTVGLIVAADTILAAGRRLPRETPDAVFWLATLLAGTLTFVLWRLLETTPPDAIRLRPGTSLAVVLAVSLGLMCLSFGFRIPVGALPFLGVWLMLIALSLVTAYWTGRSYWWATLFAWHPLPFVALSGHADLRNAGAAVLVGLVASLMASVSYGSPRAALLSLGVAMGSCVVLLS